MHVTTEGSTTTSTAEGYDTWICSNGTSNVNDSL